MGYILDTSQSPSSIPHTVIRSRTYYFQMRVPKQHQQLYGQSIRARLSECEEEARTLTTHLSHLLKQSWQSNTKVKVCIDQTLRSVRPAKVTFAAIAEEYIATRQVDHKSSMVAIRALLTVAGDREVESYKRDDARALLDNNRTMDTGDKYGRVWRLVRNAIRNEICKAAGIFKRVGKVTVQFLDSRVVS
jgi:hypothetical protein